jgi:hypothetical protein
MNTKVALISAAIACGLAVGAPAALAANYYQGFDKSIKTKVACEKKGGKWVVYQPNRSGAIQRACKVR